MHSPDPFSFENRRILTVGENNDQYSAHIEIIGNPNAFSKGDGTKLYLEAFKEMSKNPKDFISDPIKSDDVVKVYQRLKNAGIPFDGKFNLDKTELASIDFKIVTKRLDEQATGNRGTFDAGERNINYMPSDSKAPTRQPANRITRQAPAMPGNRFMAPAASAGSKLSERFR